MPATTLLSIHLDWERNLKLDGFEGSLDLRERHPRVGTETLDLRWSRDGQCLALTSKELMAFARVSEEQIFAAVDRPDSQGLAELGYTWVTNAAGSIGLRRSTLPEPAQSDRALLRLRGER